MLCCGLFNKVILSFLRRKLHCQTLLNSQWYSEAVVSGLVLIANWLCISVCILAMKHIVYFLTRKYHELNRGKYQCMYCLLSVRIVRPCMSFDSNRSVFIVLQYKSVVLQYVLKISICNPYSKTASCMFVLEIGVILWITFHYWHGTMITMTMNVSATELLMTLFSTLLRNYKNYRGEIQLYQWVHRQICCDNLSSKLLSTVGIDDKLCFDQLTTASSFIPP